MTNNHKNISGAGGTDNSGQLKKETIRSLFFFFIVPLIIASASILKVFLIEDCFAFGWTDDVFHSFVNLSVARSIIESGELPMMNYFNNFGTPLLGDLLTYPYSFQALTYWLLPDHLSMTVNRFALCFLTIAALTWYLRKYMTLASASLCAFLVFQTPGFLQHFAHYHYRMTLLLFVCLLAAQERFSNSRKFSDYFFLYIACVVLFLNINHNLSLLIVPFLLANQIFITEKKVLRLKLFHLSAAIAAGIIFSYPETLAFFLSLVGSIRMEQGYLDNLAEAPLSIKKLLLSMAGYYLPVRRTNEHIYFSIYFSLPTLTMVVMWLIHHLKEKRMPPLTYRTVLLGVLPVIAVFFLLHYKNIYDSLPLIKSTDITRIFWLSNVFLFIAVGVCLDNIHTFQISFRAAVGFVIMTTAVILFYHFILDWNVLPPPYRRAVYIFLFSLIFYLVVKINIKRFSPYGEIIFSKTVYAFFAFTLIYANLICSVDITGLSNLKSCLSHYFSPVEYASFEPEKFIPHFEPQSRVATEMTSAYGHDLKINLIDLFGSNGRSVLLDKKFTLYLLDNGLISIDQIPLAYHFSPPWKTDKLTELGIKYLIIPYENVSSAKELRKKGWTLLKSTESYHLFKNPNNAGIIYTLNGTAITPIDSNKIEFKGNAIEITLPEISTTQNLVASFIALPGYAASVDGQSRKIHSGDNSFISIVLSPGDRIAKINYQPFKIYHFLICILISIGMMVGIYFRK